MRELNLTDEIMSKCPCGGDAGFWTIELHPEDEPTWIRISDLIHDWFTLQAEVIRLNKRVEYLEGEIDDWERCGYKK